MSTTYNPSRPRHSRETRRRSPGLAFARVFSQGERDIFDATGWERRDLSRDLKGVEVPAEWPVGAALAFLQGRGATQRSSADAQMRVSVRVEMERLLTDLRASALGAGYFVRPEDAAIFTDEVGALLLSRRIVLQEPVLLSRTPRASEAKARWRWESTRGVFADEGTAAPLHSVETRVQRVITLDDADLSPLLDGRETSFPGEKRTLLALTNDLLQAAEADANLVNLSAERGTRSGASELLECIAQVVLQRGCLDLLFAETARRSGPLASLDGDRDPPAELAAGAASLDLALFLKADGQLDLRGLRHATALLVTMLEILIESQTYPDERFALLAHNERRLAVSPVSLGPVLTHLGVDPASTAAQALAASIAAVIAGEGLWQSARIAETCPAIRKAYSLDRSRRVEDARDQQVAESAEDGACPVFQSNREAILAWLRQQRALAYRIVVPEADIAVTSRTTSIRVEEVRGGETQRSATPLLQQLPEIVACVRTVWDGALLEGERFGLRHAGVTGFSRDGVLSARQGLLRAGDRDTTLMASTPVQVATLASCQPFIAMSTPCGVEMPEESQAPEMVTIVLAAWRSGLTGLAVFRRRDLPESAVVAQSAAAATIASSALNVERAQGRKEEGAVERSEKVSGEQRLQGVTLAEAERAAMEHGHTTLVETQLNRISQLEEQINQIQVKSRENGETYDAKEPPRALRHRLPPERASVTHKFVIAGHEGHITVGLYPNGSPGEIFLRMTKEGSAVAGLLDCFATAVSLALQHGVPVRLLAEQFAETRFEPAGATANEQIPYALSIMDYLFRWIEMRFLSGHQMDLFANLSPASAHAGSVRVTGTVSGPKSSVVPVVSGGRSRSDG